MYKRQILDRDCGEEGLKRLAMGDCAVNIDYTDTVDKVTGEVKVCLLYTSDRNQNCYIANIVKCRPPQNRDPLPAESEACMPWLREQFRILQPKIVVCLGRIAAKRMSRADFSVTKEHGTFIEKGGIWFMGTFHPAALLRQKQNKPGAFADFLALREKIGQVCEHTY